MYLPRHFEQNDATELHALMRAHPLATWVTQHAGEVVINHVPFLLDATRGEHGTLIGHVARAHALWQIDAPATLVFQGAQAYITPSWYPSKAEHHQVVPTWNYAVVHAHGRPRAIHDRTALLALVTRLTAHHEAARAQPWAPADAPADYIDKMLGAIVGIEIPIERLVGKWKVSQNRSAADRLGVAAGLRESTDPAQAVDAEREAMAQLVTPPGAGEPAR